MRGRSARYTRRRKQKLQVENLGIVPNCGWWWIFNWNQQRSMWCLQRRLTPFIPCSTLQDKMDDQCYYIPTVPFVLYHWWYTENEFAKQTNTFRLRLCFWYDAVSWYCRNQINHIWILAGDGILRHGLDWKLYCWENALPEVDENRIRLGWLRPWVPVTLPRIDTVARRKI